MYLKDYLNKNNAKFVFKSFLPGLISVRIVVNSDNRDNLRYDYFDFNNFISYIDRIIYYANLDDKNRKEINKLKISNNYKNLLKFKYNYKIYILIIYL